MDPPTGDTATAVFSDVRGRATGLRQYHGSSPSGTNDATQYTYTPAGQLETVTDPAGNEWSYEYDLRGRKISQDDPDRGVTDMTYDVAGQLSTTTDSEERTLAFTYDSLGRKTSTRIGSVSGAKISEWVYDTLEKGLLTSSARFDGAAVYRQAVTGYDEAYRPLGSTGSGRRRQSSLHSKSRRVLGGGSWRLLTCPTPKAGTRFTALVHPASTGGSWPGSPRDSPKACLPSCRSSTATAAQICSTSVGTVLPRGRSGGWSGQSHPSAVSS